MNNNDSLFNSYYNLPNDNLDNFANQLIQVALEGKHPPIGLLNNYAEYRVAKALLSGQKKIIKGFRQSKKLMYNKYISDLTSGTDTLQTISDCKVFLECEKFFKEDCKMLEDVMDEFEWYMLTGHLLEMLSGAERPYKDMYDSRKKQK